MSDSSLSPAGASTSANGAAGDLLEFVDVAAVDEVSAFLPRRVAVGDRDIALFNVDGEIFATDNICTHAYASLADGFVEGDTVECPLHEACFNIRTGKALKAPATVDLRTYPVRVTEGRVLVGRPRLPRIP